jgi:lycopene cyclase domain-containing protein
MVITLVSVHLNITTIHKGVFEIVVSKIFKVAFFETQYLYLLIHAITLIPVLLLSFDKKVHFYKKWKYMWQGGLIVGIFFIIWDMGKTYLGVWTFNQKYITGYYVFNLPVEEILFFITIPYACMFIYECLNHYVPFKVSVFTEQMISWILFILLLTLVVYSFEQTYTFVTAVIATIYMIYHLAFESGRIRVRFYFAFLVTFIPFVLIDGILTGAFEAEPIIIYNPEEFMGYRIISLPLEDAIYLIPLMLANITFFEKIRKGIS